MKEQSFSFLTFTDDPEVQFFFIFERFFGAGISLSEYRELTKLREAGFVVYEDPKRKSIADLPAQELASLYGFELEDLNEEVDYYSESADKDALKRYLLMDTWSLIQALCLWCGIEPSRGNRLLEWSEKNSRLAPRAADIAERWELIVSAMGDDTLRDPINSDKFIRWASKKERIDSLIFKNKISNFELGITSASRISELEMEIKQLRDNLAEIEAKFKDPKNINLATMARLFGAVCNNVYGSTDIKGSKNSAASKIAGLMFDHGWIISDRQVRTYVKAAADAFFRGKDKPVQFDLDEGPGEESSSF